MAEPVSRLLTPLIGQEEAKRVAAECAEIARCSGRSYAAVLAEHQAIAGRIELSELTKATDPGLYIGSSQQQVERALAWLVQD